MRVSHNTIIIRTRPELFSPTYYIIRSSMMDQGGGRGVYRQGAKSRECGGMGEMYGFIFLPSSYTTTTTWVLYIYKLIYRYVQYTLL